jgi:hypothetical protein
MDFIQNIRHSFQNVWHYRSLWIFGVILALTTSSWSVLTFIPNHDDDEPYESKEKVEFVLPNSNRVLLPMTIRLDDERPVDRVVINYQGKEPDFIPTNADLIVHYSTQGKIAFSYYKLYPNGNLRLERNVITQDAVRLVIMILLGLGLFALILTGLILLGRYTSASALIQMVNAEADDGIKLSARQGWRLGLSKSALRLFFIDIVINTLAVLAFALLFVCVVIPFVLTVSSGEPAIFAGFMITSSLFFLAILTVIVGSALIALTRVFVWRACVLEKLSVSASFRRGVETMVADLPQTGMVWFVTIGIRMVYPLFVIPVALLLISIGVLVGGVPALFLGGITNAISSGSDLGVILAILVGMGLFIITLMAPLILLEGLLEVFFSSLWTMTYRHVASHRSQKAPTTNLNLAETTSLA